MYYDGSERQAKYIAQLRARGIRPRTYLLTNEEHKTVRAFVDELIAARPAPEADPGPADDTSDHPVQP